MLTHQIQSIRSVFQIKSDFIGTVASGLCLVHCMLTPVLFAVQAASLSCAEISPAWWKAVDYVFLVISFVAIFFTNKSTTSTWISKALITCWIVLALIVFNESFHFLPIAHSFIYVPAVFMIGLHSYNRQFCNCQEDKCCVR